MGQVNIDDYPRVIGESIAQGGFTAADALWFPLSRSMEPRLGNMAHVSAQSPGVSRDARLQAWFQAAHDLGADPIATARSMGEHACGGFARLVKMKCHGTLGWWRDQGVELNFQGPSAFNGEPTTFATLACLQGRLASVEVLLPGSSLTHVDQLWLHAWSKSGVGNCGAITEFLETQGPVPKGCMAELAGAPINLNNIDSVIESARRVLRLGGQVNGLDKKGLTPLARAVRMINSPASAFLVDFLIEQGADPMARHDNKTVVEDALDRWIECSVRSHLRPVRQVIFMAVARACQRQQLQAMFPIHRQGEIEERIRRCERQHQNLMAPDQAWTADPEIAQMQAFWMGLDAIEPRSQPRPRGRL